MMEARFPPTREARFTLTRGAGRGRGGRRRMTNFEKLVELGETDMKALAEFFSNKFVVCKYCPIKRSCMPFYLECEKILQMWLESEMKE